jgi:hypothetical protein
MAIAIEPQGEIGPEMVLAATQPDRIVVDLSAVPSDVCMSFSPPSSTSDESGHAVGKTSKGDHQCRT